MQEQGGYSDIPVMDWFFTLLVYRLKESDAFVFGQVLRLLLGYLRAADRCRRIGFENVIFYHVLEEGFYGSQLSGPGHHGIFPVDSQVVHVCLYIFLGNLLYVIPSPAEQKRKEAARDVEPVGGDSAR
jgi:hypothetical protein